MLLNLLHLNQKENMVNKKNLKFKKGFTLVELIIALSIGATLVLVTYNTLSQSLLTVNNTTVAGTMDNYADKIRKTIKKELINLKYVDISKTKNTLLSDGSFSGICYSDETDLFMGIKFDVSEGKISLVYNPFTNSEREISSIFTPSGSNGVFVEDMRFDLNRYATDYVEHNSPDTVKEPKRLISYQFTIAKKEPQGEITRKVYHVREVLENAL